MRFLWLVKTCRERGPVEVVSPGVQGTNDSKEFSVVDVVVSFCQGE